MTTRKEIKDLLSVSYKRKEARAFDGKHLDSRNEDCCLWHQGSTDTIGSMA
jgi:hypothetical protein